MDHLDHKDSKETIEEGVSGVCSSSRTPPNLKTKRKKKQKIDVYM
jgi:hypothetical protein